jgi:KaiC/GvpD/RAD55 family RecA-like ATPase
MTEQLMTDLRRSPRKLLERDGHPGPGPGNLALVLARAGVGKTAFLVGIGVDALLAGQKVLHVSLESTVDKVRVWYDDVLREMLAREGKLEHRETVQLDTERRRHIHTYVDHSFSVERLRHSLELLTGVMHFVPDVILVDDIDIDDEHVDPDAVAAVKAIADDLGAELWMTCHTHRDDPAQPGHLPPPADRLEHLTDLAFRLDSHDAKVRLHVLKDHKRMLDEDLHILLDPQTLLLTVGLGGGA